MSKAVVHRLEVIEVDEHGRDRRLRTEGVVLGRHRQSGAVEEIRQWVSQRLVPRSGGPSIGQLSVEEDLGQQGVRCREVLGQHEDEDDCCRAERCLAMMEEAQRAGDPDRIDHIAAMTGEAGNAADGSSREGEQDAEARVAHLEIIERCGVDPEEAGEAETAREAEDVRHQRCATAIDSSMQRRNVVGDEHRHGIERCDREPDVERCGAHRSMADAQEQESAHPRADRWQPIVLTEDQLGELRLDTRSEMAGGGFALRPPRGAHDDFSTSTANS